MPSTGSAEGAGESRLDTEAADAAFLVRRRRQLRTHVDRRLVAGVVAAVAVLALLGAVFGTTPEYGSIPRDAARLRASGKLANERGGSQCVGWPAELTISARPATVEPDQVLVYLTQGGWNFAVGSDLVAADAQIVLRSPTAAFRAAGTTAPGFEVEANDGDTAIVRQREDLGPSDTPVVTTTCEVESVTVEVQDRDGRPLPDDVLRLVNGSTPGNPATFERR